jgi:hypothetical protein
MSMPMVRRRRNLVGWRVRYRRALLGRETMPAFKPMTL